MVGEYINLSKIRIINRAVIFFLSSIGSRKVIRGQRASRVAIRTGKYVVTVFGNLKMYAHCDLDYLIKRSKLLFDHLFCVETHVGRVVRCSLNGYILNFHACAFEIWEF
jgi:hypothetical protein